MEVNTLQADQFVDIFGQQAAEPGKATPGFGSEFKDVNLFEPKAQDTPGPPDPNDTPIDPPVDPLVDPKESEVKEVDILNIGSEPRGPGRPSKTEIKDITQYFEDRIKNGKFVAIEEDLADGTKAQFIPKTAEDMDELLDIQVNYRLNKEFQNIESNWYSSKSPAWQAVAKYAELSDDPTEILPFLQGVKTIDSVSDIDATTPEGAERIVRTRLTQRGDQDDVILEQIDALKTANKLVSTAEKYKPLIIKEEQQNLSQMIQERRQEEANYQNLVTEIRTKAIEAIEAPLFGKKLKNEEKSMIFELIGQPSQESKGYQIYSAIDHLFETGNFEALKKIALLITKEDSLIGYISSGTANKVAESLQRKLRVAGDLRGSSGNDPLNREPETPVINRNQFQSPRFGR